MDTDSELSSTSTNPIQNKVVYTELGKKLSSSGGIMTGMLATKGIKLKSGTDFGDTFPSNPQTNQLFFLTIGSNLILDSVYPVGSIYMNVNSTNPGTLFGGTWEQIQGRFLLGTSSSYPAGSQGGEATHTLTESEMPTHGNHLMQGGMYQDLDHNKSNDSSYRSNKLYLPKTVFTESGTFNRGWKDWNGGEMYPAGKLAGGGKSHNNMPPYLSVYIWKRTA